METVLNVLLIMTLVITMMMVMITVMQLMMAVVNMLVMVMMVIKMMFEGCDNRSYELTSLLRARSERDSVYSNDHM